MNLPQIKVVLPTPEPNVGAKDIARMGVNLLFKRQSPREMAMGIGARVAMQGAMEMLGPSAGDLAAMAGQILEENLREWEQDYLPTLRYGLIVVQGAPGEGKTTVMTYMADRFWSDRHIYVIGIPQELLPRGWKELSQKKLNDLGVAIDKAARTGEDPKELIAKLLGVNWLLLVDDVGAYIGAGGSDKPLTKAVRALIDIRRHLNGICVVTVQNLTGMDIHFTQAADAFLFKQGNEAIAGGDRYEAAAMRRQADIYFAGFNTYWRTQGLGRREIQAKRVLKAYTFCPAIELAGPWSHGRAPFFDAKFSQNAASYAADGDEAIDAEYTTQEEPNG